jgi:hypothetical protein
MFLFAVVFYAWLSGGMQIFAHYSTIYHNSRLATLFHVRFLLGLFFYPEDGGEMLLRNVG